MRYRPPTRRTRSGIRHPPQPVAPAAPACPANNAAPAGRVPRSAPLPLHPAGRATPPDASRAPGLVATAASRHRGAARRWSIRAPPGRPRHPAREGTPSPARRATCAGRVGLTSPLRLAEGAASGQPHSASSCPPADGQAGARRSVGKPAVTAGAIAAPSCNGSTRVSGPGQNVSASNSARVIEHRQPARLVPRGNMHDQRVEVGPPLGPIDRRHRFGTVCPCGEAIDSLGRDRHQLARPQQRRRLADAASCRIQSFARKICAHHRPGL